MAEACRRVHSGIVAGDRCRAGFASPVGRSDSDAATVVRTEGLVISLSCTLAFAVDETGTGRVLVPRTVITGGPNDASWALVRPLANGENACSASGRTITTTVDWTGVAPLCQLWAGQQINSGNVVPLLIGLWRMAAPTACSLTTPTGCASTSVQRRRINCPSCCGWFSRSVRVRRAQDRPCDRTVLSAYRPSLAPAALGRFGSWQRNGTYYDWAMLGDACQQSRPLVPGGRNNHLLRLAGSGQQLPVGQAFVFVDRQDAC